MPDNMIEEPVFIYMDRYMFNILYAGLSNNIREVAESLAGTKGAFHFVKPGETLSRVHNIQQIISRAHVDIIVIGETILPKTAGIPQAATIVRALRDQGVAQPVLGLTNLYTEKEWIEFHEAGIDAILPLRLHAAKRCFTINGQLLCGQIEQLVRLSQPNIYRFHDFCVDKTTKCMTFRGEPLGIRNFEERLLAELILREKRDVPVTRDELFASYRTTTKGSISKRIWLLGRNITTSLRAKGFSIDFTLIETIGKNGWKLNKSNFIRLASLVPTSEGMNVDINQTDSILDASIIYNGLCVMPHNRVIHYNHPSQRLEFTTQESRLFVSLAVKKGETLSRPELFKEHWDDQTEVNETIVNQHLRSLKRKIPAQLENFGYPPDSIMIDTVTPRSWRLSVANLQ